MQTKNSSEVMVGCQHSKVNKIFKQSGTSDERGSAEGSRDKAVLTLQLHESEKEMVRLKSQVRRLEIELEREREKYTPLPVHESTSDREKVVIFMPCFLSTKISIIKLE